MFSYVKWLQSYKFAKLEIKKKLGQFGFEATFLRLYVVNRCSPSDPGSNPGWRKL